MSDTPDQVKRDDEDPEVGAEGGGSSGLDAPFEPDEDDDSALGDTDQHSTSTS